MNNKLTLKSDILYRTYSETNGKAPVNKYGDGQIIESYEHCLKYDSFCGILNPDVILIDIDNEEHGECLKNIIECENISCKINKTERGYHFYFLNKNRRVNQNYAICCLACGLMADIKIGFNNGTACLKNNGNLRKPVYDQLNMSGTYDEIPCWLIPVGHVNKGILGMKKGDGRNNLLFGHILSLSNHNFTNDEILLTCEIINNYVFADSLDKREFRTVTRELLKNNKVGIFRKTTDCTKFRHYAVGDIIKPEFSIINGVLHIYKDGYYQSDMRAIIQKITEGDRKQLTKRQTDEVCNYLNINATEIKNPDYQYLIPFKNGNYNIMSGTITPASRDAYVLYQIPHKLNQEAYSPLSDKWLNEISDNNKEKRQLLEELIGVCMCSSNKYQKMFHIYGQGANGKTTFIDVLVKLLGEQNCSHIPLDKISERFNTQAIYGKVANISDETPSSIKKAEELIKQLTGNSPISAEAKFANQRYNFINSATLISCGNTIPNFNFSDGGIARRIVLIRFTATFPAEKRIPDMLEKLCDEISLEYLIKLGITGLKRVIGNNWRFTEAGAEDIEEIRKDGDSIYSFITDYGKRNIAGKSLSEVYGCYVNFCNEHEFSPCHERSLSKGITEYTGMRLKTYSIAGKSVRHFTD